MISFLYDLINVQKQAEMQHKKAIWTMAFALIVKQVEIVNKRIITLQGIWW